MNKHAGWYDGRLGSKLGQCVGRHVVIPGDMVELQAIKLGFELPDLPALPVLVDLLYDDFGVAVCQQALDAKRDNDPKTVYKSFIPGSVVGSLEEYLEDILELFTLRGDEEDSSAGSITVEGAVEVHDPVLGPGVWWRVLDLGPFSDKVGQGLRFDCRAWRKLNREGAEFY